jgi:Ca2+-binding RTX toxin-like protein
VGTADTVSYSDVTTAGVTVNLTTLVAQNTVGAGSDTLSLVERATGTNFPDNLTGDAGANLLSGLAGDDVLHGGAGTDTLNGGTNVTALPGDTCIDPQNATFTLCETTGTV